MHTQALSKNIFKVKPHFPLIPKIILCIIYKTMRPDFKKHENLICPLVQIFPLDKLAKQFPSNSQCLS